MGAAPMNRLVWSISCPLMVSMLVQSLYNIVDGIFVSRISEDALTATSLAYPVQMLMVAISVGAGVGLNALLSQTLGRQDTEKLTRTVQNGLFAAVCGSLIFILLSFFAVRPFLRLYTQDPEILEDAVSYLRICMLFSTGIFLATTGERCLQATGKTLLSMIAQSIGAICNVVMDPILIFGLFGLPAMGVTGAAVATVMGQWLAGLTALWLNATKNREIPLTLRAFRVDSSILKAIYRVGLPTMVTQSAGSVMMLGMNSILAAFSTTAVAFFGVYYKLQNFLYMPVNGLAQGLIPIVGYNFGAKNWDRVRSALKIALRGAVAFMLCGTLIFWLFPAWLLSLFDASAGMCAMGIPAFRILSLSFVLTGITLTIGYYFSGLGNGVVNMTAALLRQLVLLLPLTYALSHLCGLGWAWLAFPLSELAAFLFAIGCSVRKNRTLQP